MTLGDLLTTRMSERGITNADLARHLKVSDSTVLRWRRGSMPRASVRAALAAVLGLDEDAIVAAALIQPPGPTAPDRPAEALTRLDRIERRLDRIERHLGLRSDAKKPPPPG